HRRMPWTAFGVAQGTAAKLAGVTMATCHHCGAVHSDAVRFRDTCETCQAYLHCCRNCRLYSPGSHNNCLSSATEFVGDAAAINFCDELEFTSRATGPAE